MSYSPAGKKSAPSSLTPLTPSEPEKDEGALGHGVPGAWTQDDMFVTGVERSSSLMVEPSTDGQLSISHARNSSSRSAVGAAEPAAALVVSSMVDDAVEKSSDEPRAQDPVEVMH
jgi:hypothetical protein